MVHTFIVNFLTFIYHIITRNVNATLQNKSLLLKGSTDGATRALTEKEIFAFASLKTEDVTVKVKNFIGSLK